MGEIFVLLLYRINETNYGWFTQSTVRKYLLIVLLGHNTNTMILFIQLVLIAYLTLSWCFGYWYFVSLDRNPKDSIGTLIALIVITPLAIILLGVLHAIGKHIDDDGNIRNN